VKINYTQNPLATTIELNEVEKKELWYKVKVEELKERLFMAYFRLSDGDIDSAKSELDPKYYSEDAGGKTPIDARVDELYGWYLSELSEGVHGGDCTCSACACPKCHAEQLIGIDTMPGLGKHSASKIIHAFTDTRTTAKDVVAHLRNNPIKVTEDWHRAHINRWTTEQAAAIDWLENYRINILGETP